MPWHREPTKDVTSCDKPRLGAHARLTRGSPNGRTRRGDDPRRPPAEHMGRRGATRGTETSKYPEEEKSTEIPPVAASERGGGQTGARASAAGVVGPDIVQS